MPKVNKYTEIVFLAALGVLSVNAIYRHITFNNFLSVTNYLGFTALLFCIIYRYISNGARPYLVFILLILGTFNIISFTNSAVSATVGIGFVELPSFNPLLFLLCGIYCLINRKLAKHIWRSVFKESPDETKEKHQKMLAFYYDKFYALDDKDFELALLKVNEYPLEAQLALEKIAIERKN